MQVTNTKASFVSRCNASIGPCDSYGNYKFKVGENQYRIKPMKTAWKLETKIGDTWKRIDGDSYKKGNFPNIPAKDSTPSIHPDLEDIIQDKVTEDVPENVAMDTSTEQEKKGDCVSGTELIELVLRASGQMETEWSSTGSFIMNHRDRFASEAKGNRKVFYGLLDASVIPGQVPEQGINNKGETIALRKKDGSVKWAAWDKTRRFTQNMSDIFACVEVVGWDLVFPNGVLAPRHVIQDLKKGTEGKKGESPSDTFKRSILLCEKKLEEIPPEEKDLIAALIQSLNTKWAEWSA